MAYLGARETSLTQEGSERRPVGPKLGLSLPFLCPPTFPHSAQFSFLSPPRPLPRLSFLLPLLT